MDLLDYAVGIHWKPQKINELKKTGKESLTKTERFAILSKYAFECSSCGKNDMHLEIYYKIPPDRGGQALTDNLCTLCDECKWKRRPVKCLIF